jgi:peptidyl-prolyl cis-trans isomerase C
MNKSNKKYFLVALGCSAWLLGDWQLAPIGLAQAASGTPAAQSSPADPAPVAVVNGKPISREMLEVYRKHLAAARPGTPITEASIIDNLVGLQLLTDEAIKKGLDKDATVQAELDVQRINVLAGAALRDLLHSHTFTDEELKKEYERAVSAAPQKEYKASHILVKTQDEAQDVIQQLEKGKSFADLAKEKSTDTSAQQGGDLGWFVPQQMVEPFAQAVQKLEKGSYTKTPVQTEYGWHVIKLEDIRANEAPPFDSVKGQVENMLRGRLVSEHVAKLREQAKVEVLQPVAPVPESATPPSSGEKAGEKSETQKE